MFGLAVFALTGIIKDADIGGRFLDAAHFHRRSLRTGECNTGLPDYGWLSATFLPLAQKLAFSPVLLFIAMAFAFLLMRLLDPTGFIAIPVVFLPVSDMMTAAGIPPLVLIAPLMLSIAPFWLSHQNFWVAMGEGMTSNQGFSAGQRASLANVYCLAALLSIVVSVGYWKLIGLL